MGQDRTTPHGESEEIAAQARARLGGCSCWNLRKAARAVTQLYDEILQPSGLRATQLSVLAVVAAEGPASVGDLAAALVMDRTTLSRNLKPLLRAGLLRTLPDEDKRRRRIALTEGGGRALGEALPLWEEAQGRIAGALGPARWAGMIQDVAEVVRLTGR